MPKGSHVNRDLLLRNMNAWFLDSELSTYLFGLYMLW